MNQRRFYCFRFGDEETDATKLQKMQSTQKMYGAWTGAQCDPLKPRPAKNSGLGPASNGLVFVEDSLLIVMPDLFEAGGP